MENTKSTENLAPKMSNENNGRIQLVLIVIALVVAVVALIVAFIGLSMGETNIITYPNGNTISPAGQSSSSGTAGSSGDKIWAIALGHGYYNEAYIDEETGTLKGFLVDFTNAVCKTANKNCRIVYDVWTRCWDSEGGQVARGGIGLMGDWYDVCSGWYGTYDRARTYFFSDPFGRAEPSYLYVKPGSPLKSSWRDFAGKKLGILDGWVTDELCLTRNAGEFTSGTPFSGDNVVHYAEPPQLVDAVMNGEVDYAFATATTYVAAQLERASDTELPCAIHGPAMMTRQVNQELLNWWNEAQKRLMATSEYKTICKDLEEEHGHLPGQAADDYCFI